MHITTVFLLFLDYLYGSIHILELYCGRYCTNVRKIPLLSYTCFFFFCLNMKTDCLESNWTLPPWKLSWTKPCATCSCVEVLSSGSKGLFQQKYCMMLLWVIEMRCVGKKEELWSELVFLYTQWYLSHSLTPLTNSVPVRLTNFYRINFWMCRKLSKPGPQNSSEPPLNCRWNFFLFVV